ncbi:hypothetical protein NG42_19575 [Winslowiella iniecta]|uniref:DUF5071 domain-containing protein n=2 Tax=Winslowiella iniecta TaxID=1560201 RepID=A0A0L7SXH5_9GAMM|nr:hypothetical protein NG42_19575 [Winslowiella iniecta]KOC90790.1 hypothetical protein NG43_16680 [Winslowiella iniecta]
MHTRSGSNHSHADASAFLPKHKADTAAVEKLVSLSREALIPYYPVMIEWLKDFNWPVARIIAPHLATLGTLLKDDVINVLKGDDVIWKYWVVNQLVNTPDLQLAASIRSELAAQYKTLSSSLDEDDANLALEIEDVLDKLS